MTTRPETISLSRLLYSSRLDLSASLDDPSEIVKGIAAESAKRNAQVGVTGSLLFVDNSFVQVLEGPTDAVEETFERICNDFRHVDVRLVDLITVSERVFPQWAMASLCESGDSSADDTRSMEEVRFLVGINARQAVEQMRELVEAVAGDGVDRTARAA